MATFRFVHAADIHLDSPLRGLSGQEGDSARAIRSATREAFDHLVTLSIEEQVAFLILSGDLYDGNWRDYQTGLFFVGQMGRLSQAGIPVFLAYGNHDAESQITRSLVLPENVRPFGTRHAQTFRLPELKVALHGQSFRERDVTEDLVPGFPDPDPECFNIGVLHTGLGGMGGHANYAPCSLEELVAKGYDYWALGHVHQRQVLKTHPHVVFPGNLQGRHIRETGPKGAYRVTVTDEEVSDLSLCSVDVVRWEVLTVTVGKDDRFADLPDRMRSALTAASQETDGRLLACRIVLTGETGLHVRIRTSLESLLAEARAAALSLGSGVSWVERVVCGTTPLENGDGAEKDDALTELRAIFEQAGDDPELLKKLEAEMGEMVQTLPFDLRLEIEDPVLKAAIDRDYRTLLPPVAEFLLARIVEKEPKK